MNPSTPSSPTQTSSVASYPSPNNASTSSPKSSPSTLTNVYLSVRYGNSSSRSRHSRWMRRNFDGHMLLLNPLFQLLPPSAHPSVDRYRHYALCLRWRRGSIGQRRRSLYLMTKRHHRYEPTPVPPHHQLTILALVPPMAVPSLQPHSALNPPITSRYLPQTCGKRLNTPNPSLPNCNSGSTPHHQTSSPPPLPTLSSDNIGRRDTKLEYQEYIRISRIVMQLIQHILAITVLYRIQGR